MCALTQALGTPLKPFPNRYTEWDFDRWNLEYNPGCGPPCGDFAKWGMDTANPVNATWAPTLTGLYGRGPCEYVAALALPPDAVALYGAPAALFVNFSVEGDPTAPLPTVEVALSWVNKTATRLAESAWLSFSPALGAGADMGGWAFDVLGFPVSPMEVVDMGTRHIHAVWDGTRYDARESGGAFVNIRTWDTPLVAPGDTDHLLWYDGYSQPDLSGGVHYNCACKKRIASYPPPPDLRHPFNPVATLTLNPFRSVEQRVGYGFPAMVRRQWFGALHPGVGRAADAVMGGGAMKKLLSLLSASLAPTSRPAVKVWR